MSLTMCRSLRAFGLASAITVFSTAIIAAQQMPQTTQERIKGTPEVTTEHLKGTVTYVEGNTLVVRMSTGEFREFQVPESRKFNIDGREVSVHELKPGTKLTATITTTKTPVNERTTTIGSGTVWFVSGNTVIVTLPNNENRMYKVNDSYRFTVGGQPASVHDLRKGMRVSAQKIVEAPHTEIASNTVVTGFAPPEPKTEVAKATEPERPRHVEPVTEATRAPEPVPTPAAEPAKALPTTASPLPLIGVLGLLFAGVSFGMRKLRRVV